MNTTLHFRLPDEYERGQIDQLLLDKFAFIKESPISEGWTFYDTFDWRLFSQSLVLQHSGQKIVLGGLSDGESLKGLADTSSLEFVWDLPESPLSERLKSIVKMRALLPLASIHIWSITYRILNKDEKTIARLVTTEVRAPNGESRPILGNYLSLRPVRGYPKYSRKLAKLLGQAGQEASIIQDLYFDALERAGKRPGSYSGKLDIRLKPKKRSDFSAKVILRQLFEIIKANEAGIKADIDTEFLHDYRIAIRRTRSA